MLDELEERVAGRRKKADPEPTPRERKLDTAPVDWDARISEAIAAERRYQAELLTELIAEFRGEAADELERATRSLTIELADLKATLAEVRQVVAGERSKVLDLPPLPARRELN